MRKLDQKGFHHIALVLAIIVIGVIGFVGWKVAGNTKNKNTDNGTAVTMTETGEEQATSEKLIWMQRDTGWTAMETPPACPDPLNLKAPTDLSKVTAILYPGQTRGGNYKPHGGFRMDTTAN